MHSIVDIEFATLVDRRREITRLHVGGATSGVCQRATPRSRSMCRNSKGCVLMPFRCTLLPSERATRSASRP